MCGAGLYDISEKWLNKEHEDRAVSTCRRVHQSGKVSFFFTIIIILLLLHHIPFIFHLYTVKILLNLTIYLTILCLFAIYS